MKENNFAIIMAGGIGSRFWPVSTAAKPKQFRDLLGKGETLIQTTFNRLLGLVPRENIYVLTNSAYEKLVKQQLPFLNQEQIVLEPVMRNTAPAVLLAALKIYKRNKNAVMIMAPSDHWIEDEAAFAEDIALAFETAVQADKIITLGIKPTFPNTGYGYIKYDKHHKNRVKPVSNFTEKPDYQKAKQFLASGEYLWNAGIFIWNAAFILKSFEKNMPQTYQLFADNITILNTPEELGFIEKMYPSSENISIDYGILEKEEATVHVIPASFDWNDLGTWGSLYNEIDKDEQQNAGFNVRMLLENATGNIITSDENKIVIIDGLHDYIVVDEREILLILPKKREQDIKEIRALVQNKFGENLG